MTIQSQLDQVLALAEKATPDWRARAHGVVVGGEFNEYTNGKAQSQVASFNVMSNRDNAIGEQVANTELAVAAVNFLREHGPAIRAAVGGEAVAFRYLKPLGRGTYVWTRWLNIEEIGQFDSSDCQIEYAYASPPATVDVGALRELVEKWRTRIPANAGDSARVIMREACADELAALIGKDKP